MIEYQVVISKRAKRDLERNATWWAQNDDGQHARKWIRDFNAEIMSLRMLPASRSLVVETAEEFPEVRCCNFHGYRALFAITENMVQVITVQSETQAPSEPGDTPFP